MSRAIVLDVDCVIFDFYLGFEKSASISLKRNIKPIRNAYNLRERYDLTASELTQTFEHLGENFDKFTLLKDADTAFHALREADFSIHLVTSIYPSLEQKRITNLLAYNLEPDTIDCVDSFSKEPFIRRYAPLAFVDDRIENLFGVADCVENLVLINNGDDQKGFEDKRHLITHEASSLHEWVVSVPEFLEKPRMRRGMRF